MKNTIKKALLLGSYLILEICLLHAQDIEINRIIPESGSFGYVRDITQDKDGFMWFATASGAIKYDGNQLTQFLHDPSNSNSIAENVITTICADKKGIIWFGTLNNGLDRYDPLTGTFTHFRHDPNDSTSIADDHINDILEDHQGNLWIATINGLDQFNPETNHFIHFKPKKNDSTSLSDLSVRCLYEDKNGTLWIGTGNRWLSSDYHEPEYGGLNRFNRETNTFSQYRSNANEPNSLKSNKITSIFEDNNGVLWIGTHDNGLYQMNREKGTFKQMIYDPAHPEIFGNPEHEGRPESVNFITQDAAGGFWIGKHRTGSNYFNPTLQEMSAISGEEQGTIEFESATVGYTSRDGVFWLGTAREGNVYRINIQQKTIPKPFTSIEPVDVLYEEPDGSLWIGIRNQLLRVDHKSGDTLKFDAELGKTQDIELQIFDINIDQQGNLWIAATTGLFQWDSIYQKFTGYHHDPQKESSLSSNVVFTICEDSRNNFWIGTSTGLNLMNRTTGEFTLLKDIPNRNIFSILEDKTGHIWVAGWYGGGVGLYRFNPNTNSFKSYRTGSNIAYVCQDSDSVIWAGGNNGFYVYNPDLDELVQFDNSYALAGLLNMNGMVEDNLKNLWITTNEAIVRLNLKRNETSVYGKKYGVENRSLAWGNPLKGKNGDIYIGHETGYFQINPLDFPENSKPQEIFFTRFLLFDEEIHQSKNSPLKQPLQETKSIKLPYNKNVFSFDFTIIDYIDPEGVRMLYYLENFDNEWKPSYFKRRASYFNVPPGNYVFRVKGTGSNGLWSEKSIEVIILPPWFRTTLAYIFYGLLFISGIITIHKIQRKRIIRKERLKNQERELAQAKEIEKAYTELKATQAQLIQSEKMASLGELTAGIAHEIQNPLNFVNNFSEVNKELIAEMKEEIANKNLDEVIAIANDIDNNEEKIIYHGKRADAIVKSMLLHSRGSSGQKEPTDMNQLADEYLRLSYHGLRAKDKSFNADFKLEADQNLPRVRVVPQDIGRVLINLINNAFYAVYDKSRQKVEGYKPMVTVTTKKLKDQIEISVSDNGGGIPDHIMDKIFQPFFTTKPTGQGTGLGLSLSYDIIKAHGGTLHVNSVHNKGTSFIITLPE